MDDTLTLEGVLREGQWAIGISRSSEVRGACVLLWPAGDGIWEMVFGLDHERSNPGELDPFVFSVEDASAVAKVAGLDIEWAPTPNIARAVLLEQFARSRAAAESENFLTEPGQSDPPDRAWRAPDGMWARWA